ncbi:hypothetical protein Bca52824_047875 [Brassica carinata]|uniref:Uncharacterized protein n=1 Tax=Brassica carinata TaxID=52824 RepID=A0A8X7USM2_BRACI|nr:hypothetical protein Bca52824_047875 [Brassica carinata]
MLKHAMEILLSESSVVTSYYFGWTASSVAISLTCLGLTVLPINILVGSYISNMFEDSVNLLLLSRVMSWRLSKGTYNRGLLSTEAGTLARVVADATITLGGYLGRNHLLNATLLPS